MSITYQGDEKFRYCQICFRPDTEESRTLTQLFEAIDNGQLEEAKRLKKELQHWESFDPDMTRADMQIRRLERRNAV
jgi:hypothetical protein